MIRSSFFISLVVLFALYLLLPCRSCAEDPQYIIDGDPTDWSGPGTSFDSTLDVVPQQVDTIDIRGIS